MAEPSAAVHELLASPRAAAVLADAPNVAIAIETSRGPHVTPDLFVAARGALWCLAAASTLKVRVLQRRPRVGLALRAGGDTLLLAADAEVIDPAHPLQALRAGLDAALAPAVVAAFTARNAAELSGAALDAATLRLGTPPPHRVLIGCKPVAAALVADTGELVQAAGFEPGPAILRPDADQAGHDGDEDGDDVDGELHDVDLADVPARLGGLLAGTSAVLGWRGRTGPLALPVAWAPSAREGRIPARVFAALGGEADGPAAAMGDAWTGLGPSGKQGVMLRGHGTATVVGDDAVLALRADRATWWDGVETGTVAGARDR